MSTGLKEIVGLASSLVARAARHKRPLVAAAAGVGVLGLLWLLTVPGGGRMVAVDTSGLGELELAAARGMLAEGGIPARLASGRLLVEPKSLPRAREIIAGIRSSGGETADVLASLAEEDNIWRTSAQNDRRWQAAKMAALSKIVEKFHSVASAIVIYDPGDGRQLGGAGREPAAAVNVRMKRGATLTRSLAQAIADQVAGSIAGMSSRDVRVVDGGGHSYQLDAPAGPADGELRRRRLTEEYYQEKVRAALAYVDKVVVGVSLGDGADDPVVVSVAVPRSYLAGVVRTADGRGGQSAGEDPSTAAERVLAKVRQAAAAGIGDRRCRVQADWYYDVSEGAEPQVASAGPTGGSGWVGAAGAIAILSAGAASWVAGRYLRRRRWGRASSPQDSAAPLASPPSQQEPQAGNEGLVAFLNEHTAAEIASLLSLEHPQAIAIVLAQLGPARAAAVLAALNEETQAAVAVRVTTLDQIDPVAVAEVARSLAERVRSAGHEGSASGSGQARMAQMLRHAGYATEKTVLAALAGQSPTLADAVRRHMFAFDDVVQMPPERLRPALSAVDSGELAVALRTASEEVKQKVLSAMPSDAANRVKREMDRIGPVRLMEVEAAQQRVAEAVHRAESGEYLSQSSRAERQILA